MRLMAALKVGLIAALLLVQSVAFFHSATHAFEAHKHAGKVCEVTQYCADAVFADGPVAVVVIAVSLILFAMLMLAPAAVTLVRRETVRLRAPPAL